MPIQIDYALGAPGPQFAKPQPPPAPEQATACLGDCMATHGLPQYVPNYLSAIHYHLNDARIRFVEATHTYYVKWNVDDGKEYCDNISVSALIYKYFDAFDEDAVLSKMTRSRAQSDSKYFGLSNADIKAMWKENRIKASTEGTFVHELVEREMNGFDLAGSVYSPLTRIQQYLRWKSEHFVGDFVPYRTEMRLLSEAERLTGTIDLVYIRRDHGPPESTGNVLHVHIADWKCSRGIQMTNRYSNGTTLCSDLPNCNFWRYSLQQNAYVRMLESYSDFQFNGRNYSRIQVMSVKLVVFHETNEKALIVPIDIDRCRTAAIFNDRAQDVLKSATQ